MSFGETGTIFEVMPRNYVVVKVFQCANDVLLESLINILQLRQPFLSPSPSRRPLLYEVFVPFIIVKVLMFFSLLVISP